MFICEMFSMHIWKRFNNLLLSFTVYVCEIYSSTTLSIQWSTCYEIVSSLYVKFNISSLIDTRGQLLTTLSISINIVVSWSFLIDWLLISDLRTFFDTFTRDFQAPPSHGLHSGIKRFNFTDSKLWFSLFNDDFNSRFAPTKLWPLSLCMCCEYPISM